MQIPNLIQNFIRKRIVSESVLLPFFYPDEGEFESFQEGYRLVGRKTGEELVDDYAREDEAREDPEYKYFSVFYRGLGRG